MKQNNVVLSSTEEAEYIVVSEVAQKFKGDLGVVPSITNPMKMYCNNSRAILLANEPILQSRSSYPLQISLYSQSG
ncbi:hypothetical protein Tco_0641662 [Tanacetum coccineum]